MADTEVVARFRVAYTEEATRSAKHVDTARRRPGSVAWNEEVALPFVTSVPELAEELYLWAIVEAARVEAESGVRLKKGVEYCNLAVAQMHRGKLRDAYANFELAEREDLDHGDASHAGINVLEGMLLLPAGDELVNLVAVFVRGTGVPGHLLEHAREFWVRIEREHRFRLREVLPSGLLVAGDTVSVTGHRLELWRTLAGVGEDILRRKHGAGVPGLDLQQLLRREFGHGEPNTLFHGFVKKHGEVTPSNVDNQMKEALHWTGDPLTNSMIVFYVIRNYTAHYTWGQVHCLKDYGVFHDVLCHLAGFASRISLPPVAGAPLSPARLPIGVSVLPFLCTTPVMPDLSIVKEWVRQVAKALAGVEPMSISAGPPTHDVSLVIQFAEAVPDKEGLLRYLTDGMATGGHFSISVTIVP